MEHDRLYVLRFIQQLVDLAKKNRGKVTEAEMVKLAEKCWGENMAGAERGKAYNQTTKPEEDML